MTATAATATPTTAQRYLQAAERRLNNINPTAWAAITLYKASTGGPATHPEKLEQAPATLQPIINVVKAHAFNHPADPRDLSQARTRLTDADTDPADLPVLIKFTLLADIFYDVLDYASARAATQLLETNPLLDHPIYELLWFTWRNTGSRGNPCLDPDYPYIKHAARRIADYNQTAGLLLTHAADGFDDHPTNHYLTNYYLNTTAITAYAEVLRL